MRRAGVAALVFAVWVAACGGGSGSGGMPAKDPERQSVAEHDIATDLWLRRRQPRQALEHALRAVQLNDENAEACHLVALLYLDFCSRGPEECHLAEAAKYARMALDAKKEFREAKNTLGVILVHQKKYDEAISVLRPLAEDILYQTPENSWGNLGWAYLEKGDLDHAIEALRRSVAAQPNFCVGNYRLGLAYERKGSPAQAVEAFSRALETDHVECKGLQDAYAGRARTLVKLGRADDARDDLERCVQLDKRTDAGRECSALLGKLE
ncbi:MAG TPA: tetratricopeptide repeat protein [Polyangiaceae bacterium]|nr:tetratricopeptide repeat protein [Polyangiaceae bacterium]